MDARQLLISEFEYDLWANRQWLAAIGRQPNMQRAHEILEHILFAQRIWLERCGMVLPAQMDDTSLEDLFLVSTRSWTGLLADAPLDARITYLNLKGEEHTQRFAHIAMHVINHGTYHRGHLRGLAEAAGGGSFPETDLILYFREME